MSKSKRIPVPARRTGHSVFATIAFEDGTVRMTSTHEFFCKQMRWSAHVVQDYWHKVIHTQKGVWPSEVPTTVRFCLTWIVGIDCMYKLDPSSNPWLDESQTWCWRKPYGHCLYDVGISSGSPASDAHLCADDCVPHQYYGCASSTAENSNAIELESMWVNFPDGCPGSCIWFACYWGSTAGEWTGR